MRKKFLNMLEDLGGIFLALMASLVLFQVIARYIFNSSPAWTEEIARYTMIWSTLILVIVLSFDKEHISLDYFAKKIPNKFLKYINIPINLVLIWFLYNFAISGFGMINTSMQVTQRSPGLGIPMAIVYIILPLTGIFLMFESLVSVLKEFRKG